MSKKIQNNNISPASTQAQAKSANGFRYRLTRTVASSALVGALFGIIVGYAGGYLTTMGNNNQNKASANRAVDEAKGDDTNYAYVQGNPWPNRTKIQYKRNRNTVNYKLESRICSDIDKVVATKTTTSASTFRVKRPITLTVTCKPNKYKSQVTGNPDNGSFTGKFNVRTKLGGDFGAVNADKTFSKLGRNPFIIKYEMPTNHKEMMVYGKKETFGANNLNNSDLDDDTTKGEQTRSDTAFTKVNYSYNPKNGQFTYKAKTRDIRCGRILGSNLNVVRTNKDVYKTRRESGIGRVLEITLDCEQGTVYRPGLQESDYIPTAKMKVNKVPVSGSFTPQSLKEAFHIGGVQDKFFRSPNSFVVVRINSMNPVDVAASTKIYNSGSKSVGDYRNIKVNYRMNGDNRSSGDLDDTLRVKVKNPFCKTGKLNVKKLNKAKMDEKYSELASRNFGYEVNMICDEVLTQRGDTGMKFDKTINIASANSDTSSLMLTKQEIRELNNNKSKFEQYFKFNTNIAQNREVAQNSTKSSGKLDFSQRPLISGSDSERMAGGESNPIRVDIEFKDSQAKIGLVDFQSNCREVNLSANPFRAAFVDNQPKFIFKLLCKGTLSTQARLQNAINTPINGVGIKTEIDTAINNSSFGGDKALLKEEMYKKFNLDPRSFVEFEFEFEER